MAKTQYRIIDTIKGILNISSVNLHQVGEGSGIPSWQDTIDINDTVFSNDDSVGLNVFRDSDGLDFYFYDVSNSGNNINFGIYDNSAPYFFFSGADLNSNDGSFDVEIGGNTNIVSRSGSVGLFAESIFAAEGQKRNSELFLDIDDMLLRTNNPNTQEGAGLEFIGTSDRVRLYKKLSNGIQNNFELQSPTSGNSSTILPALNLPFGNDKYIPLFLTDGSTTVEADSTGLVDISSILGGAMSSEGYTESGTRVGGDLVVQIGDYDESNAGTKILIDDANEDIILFTDDFRLTNLSSGFTSFIQNVNLTTDRTLQAPDESGTLLLDAPADGNNYVRKDNSWEAINSGFTVATLPTGTVGDRAYVTDSNVTASGNFGATVAGGGANTVPVFFDGTNWIIA